LSLAAVPEDVRWRIAGALAAINATKAAFAVRDKAKSRTDTPFLMESSFRGLIYV
jgi:hypothetical protein